MNIEVVNQLNLDPIKVKLMHQKEGEGWSRPVVDAAELAYKQFLVLNLKYPKSQLVPTKEIDTFWHYHILDTLKYAKDCQSVFGHFLHHFPYFGMRGAEDEENMLAAFSRTKALFQSEFGVSIDQQNGANCEDCAPVQPGPNDDPKPNDISPSWLARPTLSAANQSANCKAPCTSCFSPSISSAA